MDIIGTIQAINAPPALAAQAQLNLDVQNANVQQQISSKLPVNQVLLGVVAGNDKNGNLIIKLAGNDLILSSPLALAKGAQLSLKIENVSGSIVAQLLSVDGKLPATQPQKVSNQLLQNPQSQTQTPGQPLQSNQQQPAAQTAVNLRVVSVLPQGAAKLAEPINFPANPNNIVADTVQLSRPSAASLNGIVIAPLPEIIQGIKAKLGLKDGSAAVNSELEESLPDEIKPGTQLRLRITGTDAPTPQRQQGAVQANEKLVGKPAWMTEAEPEVEAALQGKLQSFAAPVKVSDNGNLALKGMVLHAEQNGEVLLQTGIGKVLVNAGVKYSMLEKGSVVSLELSRMTAPEADAAPDDDLPLNNLAKNWPAMESLKEHPALTEMPPVMQKLAGMADSTFAGRMAGFVNAVKSGDLKEWLGNNYYDALADSDDGAGLIAKLKGDIATLKENFQTPGFNNWQTMLLPVFDGQQLHQARLHVKYLPDEDNVPSPSVGTRFLVEINASHFGEMQFDGLVHNSVPAKHFDLMVRSHKPFDDQTKSEIRQIFSDAADLTGFKGDLEFGVSRDFPVEPFKLMTQQKLDARVVHKDIEA